MTDLSKPPRRCRWFGHAWGDPYPRSMPLLGIQHFIGGFRWDCRRCGAKQETYAEVIGWPIS